MMPILAAMNSGGTAAPTMATTRGLTTTTTTVSRAEPPEPPIAPIKPAFRYLTAWFCPFAHRATLALEHHAERVNYESIEALGWEQRTLLYSSF